MFNRNALDLGKPLIARKAFRFAGKPYEVGDPFQWRRMSIAERKVRNMIGSGHLMMVDDIEVQEEVQEAAPVKKAATTKKKAATKKAAPKKAE